MVSREEFEDFKKTLISENDKSTYSASIKKLRIIRYILWGVEFVVAIVALVMYLTAGEKISSMGIFFASLMFCFVAFVFTTAITKALERKRLNEIREEKVPKVIDFLVGEQLNPFSVDGFLPEMFFKSAGFAGRFDDYKGEDLIDIDIPKDNGKKSGVTFKACDLKVTKEERDSDGDTHTVTVYSGAFCAVHFPFEFKCRLAINSSITGVKKFKLEDVSFNKIFQVFSDNKVEALCILTPSMMQKLMKLHEKTKMVKVTIFDNHLYLGFPGFNLFEFGKVKSGLDEEMFDEVYDDVALLLAIVDEIKKNNKVFKI